MELSFTFSLPQLASVRLYVGIKNTGLFQHSSFLSGGLVISAGLLTVRNGLLTKLSPLSGHYRSVDIVYILEEADNLIFSTSVDVSILVEKGR